MDGFSSHALKLVNEVGEVSYVKWHFKTNQGIKNLTAEQATRLAGIDPDYATRDLFKAIEGKNYPSWTVYIQRMTEAEVVKYRFNPWDVTKVWPHADYPLIPVGKMVLDRNPTNYFAEVEQAAFAPANMVPGIEPSVDKMLQGRLFSYPDTHRHRLGVNFAQIPINQPRNAKVANYQRDGFMAVNGNQGSGPNYEPNSISSAPKELSGKQSVTYTPYELTVLAKQTQVARYHPSGTDPSKTPRVSDVDFVQAGALYRLQSPDAKARLVSNIAHHLSRAKAHIRKRQIEHFRRADPEYGKRVEAEIVRVGRAKI